MDRRKNTAGLNMFLKSLPYTSSQCIFKKHIAIGTEKLRIGY